MSTLKQKAELILQEKEEKIIPENFSSSLEIFGVQGNIFTTGSMSYFYDSFEHNEHNKNYTFYSPDMTDRYPNGIYIKPQQGFASKLGVNIGESTLANVIGLTANKIKKDETICGVTGTYEGDTPSYNDDVIGNLANINLYDSSKDNMWSLSSLRFSTDGYKYQFQEARIEPNANDEYPFDMENIDEFVLPKIIDFGYVYDSQSNIQPYIVMSDFEYRVPLFDPEYRFDIELEFNLYKSYHGSQNLVFTSAFTGGINLSQNFIVAYGDIDNHTPIMGSSPQDDYTSIVDVIIRKPV